MGGSHTLGTVGNMAALPLCTNLLSCVFPGSTCAESETLLGYCTGDAYRVLMTRSNTLQEKRDVSFDKVLEKTVELGKKCIKFDGRDQEALMNNLVEREVEPQAEIGGDDDNPAENGLLEMDGETSDGKAQEEGEGAIQAD